MALEHKVFLVGHYGSSHKKIIVKSASILSFSLLLLEILVLHVCYAYHILMPSTTLTEAKQIGAVHSWTVIFHN